MLPAGTRVVTGADNVLKQELIERWFFHDEFHPLAKNHLCRLLLGHDSLTIGNKLEKPSISIITKLEEGLRLIIRLPVTKLNQPFYDPLV